MQVNFNADKSGVASGYLGAIYNDKTTVNEYIGCQKGSDNGIFCHAKKEDGTHVACSARSSHLAQAVSSLSGGARLIFAFSASGACTAISIGNSSEYQDKL